MKHLRWLLALLVSLLSASILQAQFYPASFGPGGFGVSYYRFGRSRSFSVYFSGPGGWIRYVPGSFAGSQVTTIYYYVPPPDAAPPPQAVSPDPLASVDPEKFIIIRPQKRDIPANEEDMPVPFKPGIAKGRNAEPRKPMPGEPKPPRLPPVALPELPKDDYARHILLGKAALADREYGRAERRFQQAVLAQPKESLAFFLLAQAQFALGKYQEATASIDAGMKLQPDWPSRPVSFRDLYGPHQVDWDEHLKRLQEALVSFPQEHILLFLLAYELWFDGKMEQARLLFRRALPLAPDRALIDRFLQAP